MKQFYGMSQSGNLQDAVKGLVNPKLIILMSNGKQFEEHVEELQKLYPKVPSIGCIGMSYDTIIVENGVGVAAFTEGVNVVVNLLEQVSTMPVKYIRRLEQDVEKIGASQRDTVCIDLCAGNDACVLTTMYSVLGKRGISLMGGTGDAGKVSVNGKIYEDAVAYALVKNETGKVKVYKENMYRPLAGYRLIASKTDRSKYYRGQVDKYRWMNFGSSYLPSDMNAAYLYAQFEMADEINDSRIARWNQYYELLSPLKEAGKIELPAVPENCVHNGHMFYIKTRDLEERGRLIDFMRANDILTVFHYVPLHSAPAGLKFGRFSGEDRYTTKESERLLRLPMFYQLTEEQTTYMAGKVREFYGE